MVKKRRRHSATCKPRIALEAFEGSKTISQLTSKLEIHPNMTRDRKRQLLEDGLRVFASNGERKCTSGSPSVACVSFSVTAALKSCSAA